MSLTPEQVYRLLHEPIYSWDVAARLSGIVDFLEFSERNLAWQRQREVRRAKKEADTLEFEPQDAHLLLQARKQMVESAELRFDIGLSQSVRYAGIVAYVTSIEWCMKLFNARLPHPFSSKKSDSVHILKHLSTKVAYPLSEQAATLKRMIAVRNCIVHSAGLVKGDKHETDIRAAIAALNGFGISNAGFIGDEICVDIGAVEHMAKEALIWVPALDKACSTNGTFK